MLLGVVLVTKNSNQLWFINGEGKVSYWEKLRQNCDEVTQTASKQERKHVIGSKVFQPRVSSSPLMEGEPVRDRHQEGAFFFGRHVTNVAS